MSTIAFTPMAFPADAARGSHAVVQRAATPRLRITRRGRAVLGALLVVPVALVLALSALSGTPAQAGSSASTASFDYITVVAGESLWELASWVAPGADTREVVADFVALNQLTTAEVQPGQRLAIPAQYSE